jgi:flagellar protein FliO/FliZ
MAPMPHPRAGLLAMAAVWLALAAGPPSWAGGEGPAAPPTAALGPARPRALARPGPRTVAASGVAGSLGWPAVAITLALALLGLAGRAARRVRGLGPDEPALRVVGRTALSPRHVLYLVRAGDRTLIVGTGSGGPPTLLGELTGPPMATGGDAP